MVRSLFRKSTISGLLLCSIALSLVTACASGPAGTRGPAGTQGPAGAPGVAGVAGPQGPAGAEAPAPQVAIIVITPVSVEQGKKFSVTGTGFEPNGLVTLTLAGVPLDLGKIYKEDVKSKLTAGDEFTFEVVETNKAGAFVKDVSASAMLNALATLEPGVYAVRAKDGKGTSATHPLELIKKKA
ncbi:MAG: collagen-like protein [Chloroflexi bacterium]|nr:collagen-like protein [Chloroflexota bacterium]